ncbi:MAG: recombinase family protein [Euryarchaeota archaeon]|nr:recombinase family protein [Euryarchaeota archaeon]
MAIQTDIVGRTALNRRAVGYVRVSTKEQNEETQVQQLLAQGVPREQIFIDTATSGTVPASQRSGFRALLDYIRTHGHDITTLYVFEISRIGRSFLETLDVVRSLEEECGVIVWSLSPKEAWTQTTDRSIRNLMLAIFSWVAERERENLSERTKAGVFRARGEGKHIGRPFKEINWRKVDDYRQKGLSWSAISRVMDIPYNTLIRAKARRSV